MHAFLLAEREISNYNEQITNLAAKQQAKVVPFALQRIEDVRELKKLVKFSFSEKTAIVINNIDEITPEAANAFLKNLEEPNKNIIYILTASNLENVLSTIISRCQIMRFSPAIKITNYNKQITNKSQKTNYKDALCIKDRDEAIKFVEDYLLSIEPELTHNPQLITNCETCLLVIRNLKANGNVSLQLANFIAMLNR